MTGVHEEGPDLGELDRVARRVALSSRWVSIPVRERYDIAWCAVAEALATTSGSAGERELLRAGTRALDREADEVIRKRASRRYGTYWTWVASSPSSHEDQVVERVALEQVWSQLLPYQREALLALAQHDSHEEAARSLGLSTRTLHTYLYRARRAFRALWFEHETASLKWDADRGPSSGESLRATIRRRRSSRHG